jgi:hypothetical protein
MRSELGTLPEIEHRLLKKAEGDPRFVAYAFAKWRSQMSVPLETILDCDYETIFKLALIRRPDSAEGFSGSVERMSQSLKCAQSGLVKVLRFADVADRVGATEANGLLKAARSFDEITDDE